MKRRPTITRRALGSLVTSAIGKQAGRIYRSSTTVKNKRSSGRMAQTDTGRER